MTAAAGWADLRSAVDPSEAGGKAAPLARLMRAGFAVPEGFVIPADAYRRAAAALSLDRLAAGEHSEARRRFLTSEVPAAVADGVRNGLDSLGSRSSLGPPANSADSGADLVSVAVRSSAVGEDGVVSSGAGQHESVVDVRGVEGVGRAVLRCWASGWSERAVAYRAHYSERNRERHSERREPGQGSAVEPKAMAVLIQRFVEAEASGVMFTGVTPADPSVVEAAWGPGERVVSGQVTPDSWRVDTSGILERRAGEQQDPCLTEDEVQSLHLLGQRVAAELGGPRDIEWALADGQFWILQARPITAPLPVSLPAPPPQRTVGPGPAGVVRPSSVLVGVPASPGVATGQVQVVRGPSDFAAVRPGDVLVCRETDPAWTPLFTIAAAVVTETGGVLSHAAIVAREVGIPAVLAVPHAAEILASETRVTVDGDAGRVTRGPAAS